MKLSSALKSLAKQFSILALFGLSLTSFILLLHAGQDDQWSVGQDRVNDNEIFRIKRDGSVVPGRTGLYRLGTSTETWLSAHVTSATLSESYISSLTLVSQIFTLSAATQIIPATSFLILDSTGGPLVLTSTPTISTASAVAGDYIVLTVTGTNTSVSLVDDAGNLATGLEIGYIQDGPLKVSTVTLDVNGTLGLIFNGRGKWVQLHVSTTN